MCPPPYHVVSAKLVGLAVGGTIRSSRDVALSASALPKPNPAWSSGGKLRTTLRNGAQPTGHRRSCMAECSEASEGDTKARPPDLRRRLHRGTPLPASEAIPAPQAEWTATCAATGKIRSGSSQCVATVRRRSCMDDAVEDASKERPATSRHMHHLPALATAAEPVPQLGRQGSRATKFRASGMHWPDDGGGSAAEALPPTRSKTGRHRSCMDDAVDDASKERPATSRKRNTLSPCYLQAPGGRVTNSILLASKHAARSSRVSVSL